MNTGAGRNGTGRRSSPGSNNSPDRHDNLRLSCLSVNQQAANGNPGARTPGRSQQSAPPQPVSADAGGGHRDEENDREPVLAAEGKALDVHPPEARDHCRYRQQDGHGGEELEHQVEVVGDDGCEGSHHAAEDVAVHLDHLDGLLVLDDDILQQVLVLLVHRDEVLEFPVGAQAEQPFQHDAVGAQRGGEVGEALLQFEELEYLLVLHRLAEVALDLVGAAVDLFEVLEVQDRRFIEDLEKKTRLFVGGESPRPLGGELLQHLMTFQADGDKMILGQDDAERQRVVAVGVAQDRDIGDDEDVIVLDLHAGAFLFVERRPEGVGGHPGKVGDGGQFIGARSGEAQPGPFFERRQGKLAQRLTVGLINAQHGCSLLRAGKQAILSCTDQGKKYGYSPVFA